MYLTTESIMSYLEKITDSMVSLVWFLLKKEPETRLWVLLAYQAGDHSERGTKEGKNTRAATTELGTLMEKWHSVPLEVL